MKRILCFGDSNTWGFIPGSDGDRMPADVRWPGVMQTELGHEFFVIEEAQNGRTTMWDDPCEPVDKNGLRHLPVILESQAPVDLVIVMLGVNDLKNHFNLNAFAIAHSCGVLVDKILEIEAGPDKAAPKVLLIAPAPVAVGHCPFGHLFDGATETSSGFKAAYAEVAADRGIPFLNAGDFASCPVPDTIHIDAESCARLGRAVAAKVLEIFNEKSADVDFGD
ncbi:MAG: SGNH/GDSL hydrolase family protein [Verrucomicrobia bacterium]|nr:SGNH/GDSL hydrolase family protein [Verrucomicrobiota bacterium]